MISILEDYRDFDESYRLDIRITYYTEINEKIVDSTPDQAILETLGNEIKDLIEENKKFICKDNQFKDFKIEYKNYNERNRVLVYEVYTQFKIIGKYFTDKISSVLKDYETIVYYGDKEISVIVKNVSPMLRYIGTETIE